jgi:hypothetical protein
LQRQPAFALFSNLVNILLLFAGVSIAVAWHRLLILGERPGFSGVNVATGNLWHYVGMGIVIFLISFLPALAIVFSMSALLAPANEGVPTPTVIALALLLYAVGAVAALRLSLLLPARAIADRGLTFRQTWVRTRGNTWRLFWGIVVTTVPPLLVAEIAFLVTVGRTLPDSFASKNFVTEMTAVGMVFSAYYLLILPIGIGFLSHAYRHFFQAPLETA